MLTNSDTVTTNKSAECEVLTSLLTNGTNESEGKLEKESQPLCTNSPLIDNENLTNGYDQNDDEESKSKSHRHRVRVFSNHINVGQTSPTLYARANRHLTVDGEVSTKAYPRTVDFVLVNQLPPIGSFSYKDDSVELKSPNRIKLEMFEQKIESEKQVVSNNVSKSRPHPTGVDLLSDLMPSKPIQNKADNFTSESLNLSRKESALKVIADNLSTCTLSQPSTSKGIADVDVLKNTNLTPSGKTHVTVAEMHTDASDTPASISKELAYHNFYQMVYLDMCRDEDVVDYSSHYKYNSYKFSQIGRPSNTSSPGTSNWHPKDAQSDSQS